jgi:DNA-binding NtrC family response regulator
MEKYISNILIVDDNKDILKALQFLLEEEFQNIHLTENPNNIPDIIKDNSIDIAILDLNFETGISTGEEGLKWLKYIQNFDKDIVVIIIIAYGDIELAVKAVREGAFDFIPKPWDNEKMLTTIHAACSLRKTRLKLNSVKSQKEYYKNELDRDLNKLIGKSTKMQRVLELINKSAPTDANILITGENGTGKSLIARYIHKLSTRQEQEFVNVDLGALNENLFESELFGYTKGAFTDAKKDHPGRFEVANGGTIFLDEIANLPLFLQSKLLSIIQNRKSSRLGSYKEIELDIRIITATNKDINELVSNQLFREDLLYRINTIQIELPPLRERNEDIKELAEFFLIKYTHKYQKQKLKFSNAAINALMSYSWPGNIRELDHSIEKAIILSNGGQIDVQDLYLKQTHPNTSKIKSKTTLEEIEQEAIINALNHHNWNITEAAKELAISKQSIYNKMKKYDI